MTDSSNLHRNLAPVTEAAWEQIGEEAARTFKRHVAGRRVVDVAGPFGYSYSAHNLGRVRSITASDSRIRAQLREVHPLVELRFPFTLSRAEIDDVARGSLDSDWQPVKDAAKAIAFAEDRTVFAGFEEAGIVGLGPSSSNPPLSLPEDPLLVPDAVASALSALRLAGVEGPYALVLDADTYTAVSETRDEGHPVFHHLKDLVGDIIWAPAVAGGYVLSTRGGDNQLTLGTDLSIGYDSHTAESVTLYLEETLTFSSLTAEAAVVLGR
ncbi:family 1 encapsulin nanocompartment shell protein [Rhodococcus maanshanensis]|uniref:family 1 encapsulin nanocompartment shell protein n=1 Tax=Rhodococcus maanshanensis TaxID=183556 RepID=UPI0022B5AF5C|nr:family 1 encapsulin nanocompartment shell protein [Rhodococcus maanshanensis]MCZ4554861.1 family 1 encapsulin nanocompartment shell protein [Rhodococcus maanshanensis]